MLQEERLLKQGIWHLFDKKLRPQEFVNGETTATFSSFFVNADKITATVLFSVNTPMSIGVKNEKRNFKFFRLCYTLSMNPFLPRDNRASTVRKKALTFYILVIAGFYVFLTFFKAAAPGILGFASNIFVDDIVADTNAYRQQNGLPVLRLDPELSQAAQKKAEDMFTDDYWAHVAPDGTTPWFFITGAGYDYVYAGENLAKDFQKSDAVVVAWMESPSHRQNILNGKFQDIGVAVVNGTLDGYETTLVVQMFGQKTEASQGLAATNQTTPEVLSQPESAERAGQWPAATPEESSTVEIPPKSVSVELPVQTRPQVNVFDLTRMMSLALGSMVLGFFTVDTYTARRRGLTRLSGHTVAHFALLLLLLGVTWFLKPGVVL